LAHLDATPSALTLKARQSEPIALVGTTDAGTPADDSMLTPVAWASSDEAVVSVIDGRATGVAPGSATITATVGAVSVQLAVEVSASPAPAPTPKPKSGSSGGTGVSPSVTPPPVTSPPYVDPP